MAQFKVSEPNVNNIDNSIHTKSCYSHLNTEESFPFVKKRIMKSTKQEKKQNKTKQNV